MSASDKQFWTHVAGLRGVAIMAVVLFHLNGRIWPQGYLGVDVFLVIMGYLLFCKPLQRRGWAVVPESVVFLLKRLRRIVPAMCVLIILVVAAGVLLLHSSDEIHIGRLGYRACLGQANAFLARLDSDYFGSDAAFDPLMHLWYLSVALQVYLFFAVGRAAVWRLPRVAAVLAAAAVGVASWASWQWGGASYYATWPRLWEVLAGGLVCLLPAMGRRCWATGAALLGLLVVLLSELGVLVAYAPAVVAGTVLFLRYLPASHLPGLLNAAPFQWLGRISFSVYLVHMPFIVYGHLWLQGDTSYDALLFAGSLLVGWLYWWAVEKRRFAWWLGLLVWGAALLLSHAAYKNKGFEKYSPVPILKSEPYTQWRSCTESSLHSALSPELVPEEGIFFASVHQPRQRLSSVLLGMGAPEKPASVLLLGDSHAMCSYVGLDVVLRELGRGGVFMGTIVFPFSQYEFFKNKSYCSNPRKEEALFAWIKAHPELRDIIICQRWIIRFREGGRVNMEKKLQAFLLKLQQLGRRVMLVLSIPEYSKNSPIHYQKAASLRGLKPEDFSPVCTQEQYLKQNADVLPILRRMEAAGLCRLIHVLDTLAPGEVFQMSRGRHLLMSDDNHYSPDGSEEMMRRLLPQLRDALK